MALQVGLAKITDQEIIISLLLLDIVTDYVETMMS